MRQRPRIAAQTRSSHVTPLIARGGRCARVTLALTPSYHITEPNRGAARALPPTSPPPWLHRAPLPSKQYHPTPDSRLLPTLPHPPVSAATKMNKTDIVKEYGNDLRLSNFTAAEIRFSSLAKADLRGAYFIKVVAPGTNFEGADLTDALMDRAVFVDANFRDAILTRAVLTLCAPGHGWSGPPKSAAVPCSAQRHRAFDAKAP